MARHPRVCNFNRRKCAISIAVDTLRSRRSIVEGVTACCGIAPQLAGDSRRTALQFSGDLAYAAPFGSQQRDLFALLEGERDTFPRAASILVSDVKVASRQPYETIVPPRPVRLPC